jgi:MFS family permease
LALASRTQTLSQKRAYYSIRGVYTIISFQYFVMPPNLFGLGHAFGSLVYTGFRKFAFSALLTSLGMQLFQTAVLWQVYELTGSALMLGLSGLVRAGPHMILSLVGGVVADRFNRVYLIQIGQVTNAILLLALSTLSLTGTVEVWHLYAMTLLNSAFTAITQPARTALIPSLVPRGNLVNAIALNASIGQTSQIIGPALAGITIAISGLELTYFIGGILYLASMISIIGVISNDPTSLTTKEGPWRSFIQGLNFVRSRPVITSLLLLDMGATVLGSYRALLPIFAESLGSGAAGYGMLSAAPGIGSLVGSGFILSLGDMKYKGMYTLFGVLAYCASLALLALSHWYMLTLIAAGLLGATNAIQMIPRNSVILTISPDQLRGRVEAFRSMMAGGGPPLGYTLSGALAAMLGAPVAVVLGSAACAILVSLLGIFHSELRDPYLGSQ